jgi:hypothetical protein
MGAFIGAAMGLVGAGNVCVAAGGVAGSDFIGGGEGVCAHAVDSARPLTVASMITLLGIFASLLAIGEGMRLPLP